MKANEINAIYTSKISQFLTAGYEINTNTMNGSQGEIAKIDFRKGNEVIRIMLTKEMVHGTNFFTGNAIVLTVGRCTEERVINTKDFSRGDAIIWNNRLEVIEKRTFYQIGERRDSDWYLENEEAQEALQKSKDRFHNKCMTTDHPSRTFEGFEKLMAQVAKRRLNKRSFKTTNIKKVWKEWSVNQNRYLYKVQTLKHQLILN